jgi:hypothetical protein
MAFNHCRTVAHLLAKRVYVHLSAQHLQRGVGVAQAVQGAVLPLRVLQQSTVAHQSFEGAVHTGRLAASADAQQQVRHTS